MSSTTGTEAAGADVPASQPSPRAGENTGYVAGLVGPAGDVLGGVALALYAQSRRR
jgi:hypothetical protein